MVVIFVYGGLEVAKVFPPLTGAEVIWAWSLEVSDRIKIGSR